MRRNGSPMESLSARDPGITGLNIFTVMWIMDWIIAMDIAVRCPSAALVRRTTARSFTARRCTIREAGKLHAGTNSRC